MDRGLDAAPANVAHGSRTPRRMLDSGKVVEARDQLDCCASGAVAPSQAQRPFAAAVAAHNSLARSRAGPVSKRRPSIRRAWPSCAGRRGRTPATVLRQWRLGAHTEDPRAVVSAIGSAEVPAPAGILATALGVPGFDAICSRVAPPRWVTTTTDAISDVFAAGAYSIIRRRHVRRNIRHQRFTSGAAFFCRPRTTEISISSGRAAYRNNATALSSSQTIAAGATHAVFEISMATRRSSDREHNGALTLYRGLEEGRSKPTLPDARLRIAAGDYDNDGSLDLFANGF